MTFILYIPDVAANKTRQSERNQPTVKRSRVIFILYMPDAADNKTRQFERNKQETV